MPFFSPAHRQNLVNQFWNSGRARCPHDGTELQSHFHPQAGDYFLVLACLHCGHKVQVTRYSDPQRHQFRPWTSQDLARLAHARHASLPPVCPICHLPLRQRDIPALATTLLECPRCGNHDLSSPSFIVNDTPEEALSAAK